MGTNLAGGPKAFEPLEEGSVGWLFAAAAQKSGQVLAKVIEHDGLSPSGFLMLRALMGRDGQRPGDLATVLLVSPATATSVANTLERNGYIERRRDDLDRRAVRLSITPTGRDVATATAERVDLCLRDLYDVVGKADEPVVRRYLLSIIARFHEVLDA
ncbi:MarR family winged helix-turn-helix transcriptional regulator [Actinomadura sp. 3N407]|uniref:MarR family winged helix-turn-helix transcriptional regulator n=1 Tax=Actinomadura sp. 3N407 TaxID=3457423 RepID=UPI003FCC300C